jgi:beta-glucosidase
MNMSNGGKDVPYRDPTRSVDERVADLLGRMTVEEKVAQLGSAWVFELIEDNRLRPDCAAKTLRLGIGQVTRISGASSLGAREAAQAANAIQRFLVEETRLGIPAIVHEEINSGLMARYATSFPQSIGVASSWDPDLVTSMADVIRMQMRGVGAHQGLSPVLDVCRDPRWGRTEETFGEDPYLVARMGNAFIRGLQGGDISDGVIATAKHFVGYAASEGGMNWAPAHIGAGEMKEVYLHPFEAAVRTAGLQSIMNAYNELDGLPAGADASLLTTTLRDDWGFDGVVVSDYFAIRQLTDYHRIAGTPAQAAAMALTAGIDVELPGTDCYGEPLLAALHEKALGESDLDTAVAPVLRAKYRLGLFERPFVDVDEAATEMDTTRQKALAARLARESVVLLSNDGTLPVAAGVSIAVIGPNAHVARNLLGDYSYLAHVESLAEMHLENNVFSIPIPDEYEIAAARIEAPAVLDVLRERFGSGVAFAPGCGVNDDSTEGFADAIALAARADVAIMVMGDKAGLTDDCTSGETRDRASLDLPGVQEDLVRAVVATGTPVVVVLVAGRPCGSEWLHDNCAAVVMAWLPGQEGAGAIADVLGGEFNPGGKLPISYPRSVGQIPVFYGHKVSGGRSHWKGDYVDMPSTPRYPFGHGLSYTTFSIEDVLLVEREPLTAADVATIGACVANTGPVAGDEVVQLYIRDVEAALTRPVLELKSFVRLSLEPGESKTVTFRLPVAQLGYYDRNGVYVVEPGSIDVFVGTSSTDLTDAGTLTIVPGPLDVVKAFDGTVSIV